MVLFLYRLIFIYKPDNKKFMKLLIYTILIYILSYTRSVAYIDPGTGSIILQVLLGFIASIFIFIKIYWYKFKLLLFKIVKKIKKT